MITRNGTLAVLIAALACAAPATAGAAPTKITMRIEGKNKTIFEGKVSTDIHDVDAGDGTGAHKCNGTNGGAGTTAGITATSAMDDAVKLAGLTWDGSYDSSFDDFIVNRIGPDTGGGNAFWGVAVAGQSLQVGGCQRVVAKGEEVLWAYDLFNKKYLLHAAGNSTVRVGKVYTIKVTDSQTGKLVKGASVANKKTNAKGLVKLRFKNPGTRRFKATEPSSLRSNLLTVKIKKKR